MMRRPATLAEAARIATVDETEYRIAFAGFLDYFYSNPDDRQHMIEEEPAKTGETVFDASMGAVGEHLARRWGLRIPEWTEDGDRFLRTPAFASPIESLKALLLVQSPLAFRRRMIFVEHEPLRRARMPPSEKADRHGRDGIGRRPKCGDLPSK